MDHIRPLMRHKLNLNFMIIKKQRNFKKPLNSSDLGYFLAGLIDADGYLRKKELVITLNKTDISLGLWLKKIFGGRLRKYKSRRAFNYELYTSLELIRVANLIRHKLRYAKRVKQYNTALAPSLGCALSKINNEPINTNYWFCGFTFGDGSFQIKVTKRGKTNKLRAQISLQFSLTYDALVLLEQIKSHFGGSIGYRGKSNTVYYGSGSVINASKIIDYFESYPMIFRQRRLFELFKCAYNILRTKNHLNSTGIKQFLNLRKSASVLRQNSARIKNLSLN